MTTPHATNHVGQTWKRRLKPIAGWFGIHASADLWQGLAARSYRHKLQTDGGFRDWFEAEASRWVADHWAHERLDGTVAQLHLASQLYELAETIRRRIGPLDTATVLDAGASDGFFLDRLGARRGVGVNFLEACAKRIWSHGFVACLADIERLPFHDKAFDYVICCQTLEHVRNPIHTLNELSRVCRGRVHLSIPWLPRTRISSRPPGWPETESHIFEFSEADFARILSHTRLRMVHRERVRVFQEPRNPVTRWWLSHWMYPVYFPLLQYYELQPW